MRNNNKKQKTLEHLYTLVLLDTSAMCNLIQKKNSTHWHIWKSRRGWHNTRLYHRL